MRHDESHTQQECVKWFRLQYAKLARNLIAIPNGGARNAREAAIMKGEGVTAGAADLVLFAANHNYHGLCIEMKTKEGCQSQSQKEWQQAVTAQGYLYAVIRGFDGFKELIDWYLKEETSC